MNAKPWQNWISEHGAKLVLFARRWAWDHAEAEDVVQEAFVRFWRTRDGVRDPLSYLYRCVRSVAVDTARSRRARSRREVAVGERQAASGYFSDALVCEESSQRIKAALVELPPEQSEVVTLKIWSELTFAQIAEVTDTPVGTVASRYRYAIERLRRTLEENEWA